MLTSESDVAVDPATAAMPMTLPAPVANTDWAQSGGNASKSMGHLALGTALGQAFSVSDRPRQQPDRRGSRRRRSSPTAGSTRSTRCGTVRAFDAQTGGQGVGEPVRPDDRAMSASLYGGGVAYDNGRIYATNGLGYVAALDAAQRRHRLAGPPGRPAARRPDGRRRHASM